jgi:DNA-binding transcriptional LysR family regulator
VDSLNPLKVFMRTADARSFASAGRQLCLSPSAVAKAITRLEDHLNVRLFHRNTRNITMTHEGKILLESCHRIFSEIGTVETLFAQVLAAPKGKLRVSLPSSGTFMMPVLAHFIRDYPDIELEIDFADHLVDVINSGYDVIVRSGDISDSNLMTRSLGAYRLVIVGSRDYLKRTGIPRTPSDLVKHTCLHLKHEQNGMIRRWAVAATETNGHLSLPRAVVASTWEPLLILTELGLGLACLPDFAIRRQLAEGSLMHVLEKYEGEVEIIRACWPSSRHLSPKVRVFIDFLANNLFPRDKLIRKRVSATA